MDRMVEKAARWEPVGGIPQTPCADFTFESCEDGRLNLTLRYSWVRGNDADLVLEFAEVRALRTFWDGDGDQPRFDDPPRCLGNDNQYVWPLLIIEPSAWLRNGSFAVSIHIADSMNEQPWRHYRVLTLERSIDVLARGPVVGRWLVG
jgi:hypothetical protein